MPLSTKQKLSLAASVGWLAAWFGDPSITIFRLNVETWAAENQYDQLYKSIPWATAQAVVVNAYNWIGWGYEQVTGEFGLGLIIGSLALAFWDPIARYSRRFRERPIPIAISEVKLQWFSNYAGFHDSTVPEDDQAWSFGNVQIANISDTKTVSLKIYLCINEKEGEPKFNLKLLANGLGSWNLKYQEQRAVSKGGSTWDIVPTGRPVPNIIRCPLNLKPQDPPIEAGLVFISKWGARFGKELHLAQGITNLLTRC